MSNQATEWAWEQKAGTSSAKLVLLALAAKADANNCAWQTNNQLTHEAGINKNTVVAALSKLKSLGLIEDTGARRGMTASVVVYRLCMPQVAA